MLLLLGCGVVATAILRDSKGFGGGWLLINFGWGLGVYAGVYVATIFVARGTGWNMGGTGNAAVNGSSAAGRRAWYAPASMRRRTGGGR